MNKKRPGRTIRLRYVALASLSVAIIATLSSFGVRLGEPEPANLVVPLANALIIACLAILAYTYLGYPLVLAILAACSRRNAQKADITPSVSVILAAYNEAGVIRAKLENLLALDYPEAQLEVLVGSDGSSDDTVKIAESFDNPRIRVFEYTDRAGKVSVINRLVAEASSEVLVFTDASEMFDSQAIRKLVANFADPKVGAVSGELMMTDTNSGGSAKSVSAYWTYEKKLRSMESRLYSMLGATGAIYALRRELFQAPPSNTLLDDVAIPLAAVREGYRVVFEPQALAYERATAKRGDEFKRKTRTLTGNFQEYFHLDPFLTPHTLKIAFQVFSHKVLRLLAPLFMALLLGLTLFTPGPLAIALLAMQLAFFCLAFVGTAFPRFKSRLVSVPSMFCVLNGAAIMGAYQYFLRSERVQSGQSALWEKTKKHNAALEITGQEIEGQSAPGAPQFHEVSAYHRIKRGFDFAAAWIGVILSAPLMAMVALAVKLDSRGPVVYSQERIGRGGKAFTMYKFRSMVDGAETQSGPVWASKQDPRVTRVGGFIRKYHLDELPQLFNVIRGDMSLIGPRPERPHFVGDLNQQIDGYADRHLVKPGITGLAQVLHKYDESLQDVQEKLEEYDKKKRILNSRT